MKYNEFSNFFIINEILHDIIGFDEKGVAFISFLLYGILLALFLYLIYSRIVDNKYENLNQKDIRFCNNALKYSFELL